MTRRFIGRNLRRAAPVIAPSMLKCDFGNLHREVELLESAGAPLFHWDVMDGHFVPNLSYGAMVIGSIRDLTDVPFEAHLMISDPEKYLPDFLAAGVDLVTFHVEAVPQPGRLLRHIREEGRAAGLALNPETPVAAVTPFLKDCDAVLVMSVHPGFGGQKFLPEALAKLRELRPLIGPDTLLSVDGGIGLDTIAETADAGAQVFVAGSAIFDTADYGEALRGLHDAAHSAAISAHRE